MHKPRCRRAAIAAAWLFAMAGAPVALAQTPTLLLSGYGTAGLVRSDNDQADYLVDPFRPDGPGHSHRWAYAPDTRVGAQASATFSPRISGVVQVISQQRYDNTWTPTVEWANLRFRVTDDFSVRAGRVVLPIFMLTDSRRVGYANPWVRPPVEVYGLVPVTTNDGVDANLRLPVGSAALALQLTAGRADTRFPKYSDFDPGTTEARRILAGNAVLELGSLTLRANYGRANLSIHALDSFFDVYRLLGPAGERIIDRYGLVDRGIDFMGVGAMYDASRWFAMSEWSNFDTHSMLGERRAWYASAGVRLGKFTPYATIAHVRSVQKGPEPGVDPATLPPELAPVAAELNNLLNAQLMANLGQRTISVGVRWDFARNAALKLQFDRVDLAPGGQGVFGNLQPGFHPGGRAGIYSAAVDFVF